MSTSTSRVLLSLVVAATACRRPSDPRPSESGGRVLVSAVVPTGVPLLSMSASELRVVPPKEGWALGRVSWVAVDRAGLVYLIQRGDQADPIVVIDRAGRVVRSWGRGLYVLPHGIRVDLDGNVWTTDASTSIVRKFSPDGTLLLTITVGDVPASCLARARTCGTTDVGFGPNGHVYVTDGYANARVLEYAANGDKVRQWGTPGSGPGQFNLPHSIAIDDGIIYIADRGNSRVQRFDLEGRFLSEWPVPGNPFSLQLANGTLWVDIARREASGTLQPTLAKMELRTGRVLGIGNVPGGHGIAALARGDTIVMDSASTAFLVTVGSPRP